MVVVVTGLVLDARRRERGEDGEGRSNEDEGGDLNHCWGSGGGTRGGRTTGTWRPFGEGGTWAACWIQLPVVERGESNRRLVMRVGESVEERERSKRRWEEREKGENPRGASRPQRGERPDLAPVTLLLSFYFLSSPLLYTM